VFPQSAPGHTPAHVTGSLHTVFHSTAFVLTRDLVIAALVALWLGLARDQEVSLAGAQIAELLQGDLDLNTQGLVVWLDRLKKG